MLMFSSEATLMEDFKEISKSVAQTVSDPSLISNKKFSKIGIGVRAGMAGITFANNFSSTLLFTLNSIKLSFVEHRKIIKRESNYNIFQPKLMLKRGF